MKELNKRECAHYYKQFREFIEATNPISEESWRLIYEITSVKEVRRGDLLLSFDAVETGFRFLGKGVVKCEDTYNGKTFVYDFRVAPIILSEPVSLISEKKARLGLVAVSDCEFIEIPRDAYLKYAYRFPDMFMFGLSAITNYMAMMFQKQAYMRTLSAEERYKQFLLDFPVVVRYAKMEDVASYIDVTPQSLSRIRKKVVWGEGETQLRRLSNELDLINHWK